MIDFKSFFDSYRRHVRPVKLAQVKPLEFLVGKLMADSRVSLAQKAYILATAAHETAWTYRPISEYGKGRGRPYGRKDTRTGHAYYGRGYVQLTWKTNYQKMGRLLGKDLVNHPEMAKVPEVAYEILVIGMKDGYFTGKKLSDYINSGGANFKHARRIVNGMDRAGHIANIAKNMLRALEDIKTIKPEIKKYPEREKQPPKVSEMEKIVPHVKEEPWIIRLIKLIYNYFKGDK